jgi:hypothetical protein
MWQEIFNILAGLGGFGVIIIAVSKLVGGIFRDHLKENDRKSTEIELVNERHLLDIRKIQVEKYNTSQFEVYLELWRTLINLQKKVDDLWGNVTETNIETLLRQLHTTQQKVNENAILFQEEHFQELQNLFEVINSFHTGKLSLCEIQTESDLEYIKIDEIGKQVNENINYKNQLKDSLDILRKDFREKLYPDHFV